MGTCNNCKHCEKGVEIAGEIYNLCWYTTDAEHVNLDKMCYGWAPVTTLEPRKTRPLSRGIGGLKVRH